MTDQPAPNQDNLPQDLIKILTEASIPTEVQQRILDKLVPYIVDRDHKILAHGRATAGEG